MILVTGEALIDLTHGPDSAGFAAHPGGGPCNTAVGLGRLGVPVTYLGTVSSDAFGDRIAAHLESSGVTIVPEIRTPHPTTLAIAAVDADGQAEYAFYMDGTSAAQLFPGRVPAPLDPSIAAIHVGTLGLVLEPTATTLVSLVIAEAPHRVIAVDPNIRSAVIPDMAVHLARLDTVFRRADVVRLSEDDARLMDPDTSPGDTAIGIARRGASLVVLSRGGDGVVAIRRNPEGDGYLRVDRPIPSVPVADTIGAGDSFNAGLLAWLHDHGRLSKPAIAGLSEEEVIAAVDFAVTVAAVTVTRPGADPPWRTELAS